MPMVAEVSLFKVAEVPSNRYVYTLPFLIVQIIEKPIWGMNQAFGMNSLKPCLNLNNLILR